jgi:hypothetical protein
MPIIQFTKEQVQEHIEMGRDLRDSESLCVRIEPAQDCDGLCCGYLDRSKSRFTSAEDLANIRDLIDSGWIDARYEPAPGLQCTSLGPHSHLIISGKNPNAGPKISAIPQETNYETEE